MQQYTGLLNTSAATYFMMRTIYPPQTEPGRFCIFLAHDEREYRALVSNLTSWQQYFPHIPIYPMNVNTQGAVASLYYYGHKKTGVYVILQDQWDMVQSAASAFSENTLRICKGDIQTPDEIKQRLLDRGYEPHEDTYAGYFRSRGGVITLNSAQYEDSIRIEFGYDGIEDIKLGTERVDFVEVLPMMYRAATKKKNSVDVSDAQFFLLNAALHDETLQHIPFSTKNSIDLSFLGKTEQSSFVLPRAYSRKTIQSFKKDMAAYVRDGYSVVVASIDEDVIKTVFADIDATLEETRLQVIPFSADAESFIDTEHKLISYAQQDIFGRDYLKIARQSKKHAAEMLKTLQKGDYVTHIDYGVARYQGIVEMQIDGFTRENVLLEYGAQDKLYLPVDLVYKIDKYVGAENPKLNRLSENVWKNTKRAVREDIERIATDLIKLYARRDVSYVSPMQKEFSEEEDLSASFPYKETPDQKKAIEKILHLLEKDKPMDALVVGDVGFGKTEVAVRAAYKTVLNGYQVAFLCPTTILAQQHYDTLVKRFSGTGVRIATLSRFTKLLQGKESEKMIINKAKVGEVDILIGTHRLFSNDIAFKKLGLLIIDEEQKFGVKHKEKLKKLKNTVHVLTMTATPIPRTLYFSLSGVRDLCTIETPPQGRLPIKNYVGITDDARIYKAIEFELSRGGQVYVIHNRVETIDAALHKLKDVMKDSKKKIRYGVLHGKLPEDEIASTMHAFDVGEIDVLLCSSIIENGLDMPNVNTLLVMNAHKFGLGQLYQFRGRIGRSDRQAYAYFFYPAQKMTPLSLKRLSAIEDAHELGAGYQLAMRDLEMRGMGNLLGKAQHGHIRSVGLSLYTSMLQNAVEKISTGQEIAFDVWEKGADVTIDIPLDYEIPAHIIPDEIKRLSLYRSFSEISEIQELADYYIKHFKKYNESRIENLYNILRVRILAREKNVQDITHVSFHDERYGLVKQLLITFKSESDIPKDAQHHDIWWVSGKTIKANVVALKNLCAEVEQLLMM